MVLLPDLAGIFIFQAAIVYPQPQILLCCKLQQPQALQLAACHRQPPCIPEVVQGLVGRPAQLQAPACKLRRIVVGEAQLQQIDALGPGLVQPQQKLPHLVLTAGEYRHLHQHIRDQLHRHLQILQHRLLLGGRVLLLDGKTDLIQPGLAQLLGQRTGEQISGGVQPQMHTREQLPQPGQKTPPPAGGTAAALRR